MAATNSAPFSIRIRANQQPEWSTTSLTFALGESIDLKTLVNDPDGTDAALTFTKVSGPTAITLSGSTLTVQSTAAPGLNNVTIRVSDGISPPLDQVLALTVQDSAPPPPPPTVIGDLTITQVEHFLRDPTFPSAGEHWNIHWLDKRGNLIMWGDGDHGEPAGAGGSTQNSNADANTVRYYNRGTTAVHGIAPGTVGRLFPNRDTFRTGSPYPLTSSSSIQTITANRQVQGPESRFFFQYLGYKVLTAVSGGVINLWHGTATNKVELIDTISDGTPARPSNVAWESFPAQEDLSIKSLPWPEIFQCPQGFYVEFVPNDPEVPMTGEIMFRRTTAYAALSAPYFAPASDYDNLTWWYNPVADKMFWVPEVDAPGGGGRGGIYDMATNRWEYGNNDINRDQWPTGPWWWDYIKRPSDTSTIISNYNNPTGYSEMLDTCISITASSGGFYIIDPNPNHPTTDTQPYRVRKVQYSSAQYPWVITIAASTGSGWYQSYLNAGVCIGEWFYFFKPASFAERRTYPDSDGVNVGSMIRFFKVRIANLAAGVPVQWKELAPMPEYYRASSPTSSSGTKLFHDSDSNSIIAPYNKLWVYDIDADVWLDRTFAGYRAAVDILGGGPVPSLTDPGKREIVYKGNVLSNSSQTIGGVSIEHYFSKLLLSGGKPRMRITRRAPAHPYPGNTNADPWTGKHLRFLYTDKWVDKETGQLQRVSGQEPGYVFQCGGDYGGVPFSNSLKLANYPWFVDFWEDIEYLDGAPRFIRSSTGTLLSSGAGYNFYGYVVTAPITGGAVTIRASSSATSEVFYTIPNGTPVGTRVFTLTSGGHGSGAYAEFAPGATGEIIALTQRPRIATSNALYFNYRVTRTPTAPIRIYRTSSPTGLAADIITTIPAGAPVGTTGGEDLIPPVGPTALYVDYQGDGCVRLTVNGTSAYDSGRSDCYRTLATDEAGGTNKIEMTVNQVPFYPYQDGMSITQDPNVDWGPKHPDQVGYIVDKRGDIWVGPQYYRFAINTRPTSTGPGEGMFRFRLPRVATVAEDGVGFVRKGDAYWRPPTQNFVLATGSPDVRPGVDITVGTGGIPGLFGGSNCWSCYDEKADSVKMIVRPVWQPGSLTINVFDFPLVGATQYQWTRRQLQADPQALLDFLNTQTRGGAVWGATSSSANFLGNAKFWTAAQKVRGDFAYVHFMVGSPGGTRDHRCAFIAKINLRTDAVSYIGIPTHHLRGWDAPFTPGGADYSSSTGTINEYRDMDMLGHYIVLAPANEYHVRDVDPFLHWYDTTRNVWHASKTWDELKADAVDANGLDKVTGQPWPTGPNFNKGAFVAVPETGEVWVMNASNTNPFIYKYRII